MKLHQLISATLTILVGAAGCSKDFNDTIACSSDFNCPSGYHCASTGKCQTGEATVKVAWVSPQAASLAHGTQTFSVRVSHPDGVGSVKLLSGTIQLGTFTAPSASFGASAPAQVDFTNVDTSRVADGNVTLNATATSSKGQGAANATRAFIIDNHESVPVITTSSPASPNNTNSATMLLKGTADVGPNVAPSTVYIFTDSTCNNGVVGGASASGTAASFLEPGFTLPAVANAATPYFAMAVDSLGNSSGCSSAFTYVNDQLEPAPSFAPAPLFSGNTTSGPLLVGTAATGPSASTIHLFADPGCGGAEVASGPATDFTAAGIQVPLVPNARTIYSALSTDAAGNLSACSNTVASGNAVFTNAQFCADPIGSAQLFSANLQGCGGKVTFANRATLCAPGCRAVTADEWVTNFGTTAPTHHYWTNDVLSFSSGAGTCGTAGCNTNVCFATRALAPAGFPCIAGQPMRVCAGTGAANFADPDGNTCTWTACGFNSIAPKQFFGGCSGTNDATAGTLCTCAITQWFVSTAGDDGNTGTTSDKPLKTIAKALTLAQAGETVFVSPGVYNGANGETFPITVPAGITLLGDEANRGGGTTATRIVAGGAGNAVVLKAGSTLAGFAVSGSGGALAAVLVGGAGVTVRSNTIASAGSFGLEVSGAAQYRALLNSITGNNIGFLARNAVATGKVENNSITGNSFGIDFEILGGDPGGGATGSVGNNTLSCNTSNDLWTNSVGFSANNNRWDHVPVTLLCGSGGDLCAQGVVAPATTGAVVASPVCP